MESIATQLDQPIKQKKSQHTYAYMRISTQEERKKQRYTRQEDGLNSYAKSHNIKYHKIYKDDASGKDFNRPEWLELEDSLNSGDTIVFKDISRFIRNAELGYSKYIELARQDINLVFVDNPTLCTNYINNMVAIAKEHDTIVREVLNNTIKLLIMVELDRVQKEREIFIQRVKDGIRASDKPSGRKPNTLDKLTTETADKIEKYLTDRTITVSFLMKDCQLSRNTVKKYIKLAKEGKLRQHIKV